MGPNFVDELDCGNFFDQIDDLIEFPPESECGGGLLIGSGDCEEFPSMWTDALPDSDPLFSGNHGNPEPDLSTELYVPYEDIVQLEWLSTFVEESFSGGGMTIGKENLCANKEQPSSLITQFQISSPVSVLESSSSSYSGGSGKILPPLSPTHRGPHRARSKRPRPATFNPRTAIQLISPSSSSFIETPHPFLSDNFADSPTLAKKLPEPFRAKPRKKKIKASFLVKQVEMAPNDHGVGRPMQKCLHCEITKTPQWRSGPLGPKTLCNACGVRYKSGRLFPEYRPAASPTYVPSLHSHSHKKVVEMRIKGAIGDTNVAKLEFVPTDSK